MPKIVYTGRGPCPVTFGTIRPLSGVPVEFPDDVAAALLERSDFQPADHKQPDPIVIEEIPDVD